MGGPVWACVPVLRWRGPWAQMAGGPWCKGEKKKRHRQRARALLGLIVSHIARGPVHYTKTGHRWPYFRIIQN